MISPTLAYETPARYFAYIRRTLELYTMPPFLGFSIAQDNTVDLPDQPRLAQTKKKPKFNRTVLFQDWSYNLSQKHGER